MDSDRVHGGEGYAANLTCHIHANPRATVTWTKNSLPVENGPRYRLVGDSSVANSGGRRLLVIPRLGVEDFANYSCIAINSMGKEEAIMEVTGMKSYLSRALIDDLINYPKVIRRSRDFPRWFDSFPGRICGASPGSQRATPTYPNTDCSTEKCP